MSFMSSVFNVMMNILTAAVYIVLHRNESELKFNILVSWSRKVQNVSSTEYANSVVQSVDPFLRTGRRVSLAKKLALINYGRSKTVRFEIMAAKKQIDSYTLYGVMQFDKGSESAAALLAKFMEKVDAIISAFGYYPDFTDHLDFQIEVSQSETSSRADKVKLVSDLLTELGVDEEKLQQSLSWIPMEIQSVRSGRSANTLSIAHELSSPTTTEGLTSSKHVSTAGADDNVVDQHTADNERLRRQLEEIQKKLEERDSKLKDREEKLAAANLKIEQYEADRLQLTAAAQSNPVHEIVPSASIVVDMQTVNEYMD